MKNDNILVLTFVLKDAEKNNYQNITQIIINFLSSVDIKIKKLSVLKKNKAGDFFFNDNLKNFKLKNLKKRINKIPVDFCIQNSSLRKKKVLITDMDGTIIENETLNDIAKFLGKGEQVKKITDLGLKGRLDFSTSLTNRVNLLNGLRLSSLEEAKRIVSFMKGSKKLFQELKKNKIHTILVSGGFKPITSYVKDYLNIDQEYSNTFGVIGDLFNGKTVGPIVNANYKEKIVKKISKELKINRDEIIGMGDAANDMNMLLSVGLPIAFKAQDIVKANFENQINNTDLTSLLYFMGIKN